MAAFRYAERSGCEAASWLPPAHTASGASTANSHFIPDSEVDGRCPVPLRSWRDHTGAGVPHATAATSWIPR